ncbi:hypothetical protein MUK42_35028 [Musa troglodytarum]|uniref:Uncharacterized protein n=1 Tax=Musa troglodytarum TaxID=320322 RepID=A0A9E7KHJ7_9LILI|nr:hypothetical protein MUK42_35028 [Musa troglodytarum]
MRRDIKIGAADAGDLAEGSHAGRNVLPFAWLVGGKFLLLKSTSMFEGEQSLLYHQELLAGFLTGLLPFKIGTRIEKFQAMKRYRKRKQLLPSLIHHIATALFLCLLLS